MIIKKINSMNNQNKYFVLKNKIFLINVYNKILILIIVNILLICTESV